MVGSTAPTVASYLSSLPPDRRAALEPVRTIILDHLPKGYAEGMQYGMIGYHVPLSLYPPGYHAKKGEPLPYAALAAQKNYCSVYLMAVYGSKEDEQWFRSAWQKTGKKLDMGKSCIRFKKAEDLALDVIGQAIARTTPEELIRRYEARTAQ